MGGEFIQSLDFIWLRSHPLDDNTKPDKFSAHLVVKSPAFIFVNMLHLSHFIHGYCTITQAFQSVRDIVDLSVYTSNRCFRVAGATKHPTTTSCQTILLPAGISNHEEMFDPSNRDLWFTTLVCSASPVTTLRSFPGRVLNVQAYHLCYTTSAHPS